MPKYLIAEKGPLKGQVLKLGNAKEYFIGRDPDLVDFVLEDSTVSRNHCKIIKTADGYLLENLSATNPIEINDESLTAPYLLEEGDIFQIGSNVFKFSEKKDPSLKTIAITKKKKSVKDQSQELNQTVFETDEKNVDELEVEDNEKSPEEQNFETIKSDEEIEDLPTDEETYDTIFEEDIEEEEPYDVLTEESIILKVISGPNAGAEFAMDKGHIYIIGKDPSTCDIIFNDMSVSKNHAKLTLEENGDIYIEDLNSKNSVIINSKRISGKTLITLQDLISLGTTTFVILDPKAAYETIYSPTPEIEPEETPLDEESSIEEKIKHKWKKQIIPKTHLIVGSSIFLIFFIMFISFFSLFKSEKIEVAHKKPEKEIKLALEKFPKVEFSYNPANGKLFLLGNVLNPIEEKELLYNLKNIDAIASLENNIIIDEYVEKNTNDLLSENPKWRGISIHSHTPGKYILSGYIDTPEEMDNLMNYLRVNFDYVDNLTNKVVINNVLQIEVQSMILSKGLGSISFQIADGEVILAGRYGQDSAKIFSKFLQELKKINGVRSIKNLAMVTTPEMARIDLSKRYKISGYVSLDDKNIISVIANNKMVSKGDYLDGLELTEIKSNVIYLEKDGIKYKIDYKQE